MYGHHFSTFSLYLFFVGQGSSKKAAKQEAAMAALKILELEIENG